MQHDMQYSGLAIGMFLGGLLMALVPIALTIGLGIWALRQRTLPEEESAAPSDPASQEKT